MTGYLVTWRTSDGTPGHYLEWIPADREYGFYAAEPRFATVFSRAAALAMARSQKQQGRDVWVIPDVLGREPQVLEYDVWTPQGAA